LVESEEHDSRLHVAMLAVLDDAAVCRADERITVALD
jgi:hypothetical protein